MSWRDVVAELGVKVHPAADGFPMMSDAELDELAADIAKNGLQQSIVWISTKEGLLLLDGRNRLAAIARVADQKRRDELEEELQKRAVILPGFADPWSYVVSANLLRRHLTAEQKRELIATLLKADPERSDRAIAKTVKVDHKTVAKVRVESEGRGEIPHVTKRSDTKGRKQPARKPTGIVTAVKKGVPIVTAVKPPDTPRIVTAVNGPEPAAAPKPPEDAVTEICEMVKAALVNLRPEDRDRLLGGLEKIIRDQRLYAGLPPEVAARRKAGAERKRRHDNKRRREAGQQA
jgi:hypothetical protein